MWSNRRLTMVVIGISVLVVGAGIAFAAWTATRTDSDPAGGAVSVTVTATTGMPDLYPGATTGDLHFTLTNPNPFAIRFTSMALGSGGITSSDPAKCPASNVTVSPASGLTFDVAANTTSAPLVIADVVAMPTTAPESCRGMPFEVSIMLSGTRV